MQITYQKRDGSTIQKYRNTMLPYKIGETTSIGWKVLNIEYEYKNKYYPEHEFYLLIHKNKQRYILRKQTIELCVNEFKKLLYCILAVLIVKVLLGM